jgi:SAM-dependent methyltransferase
MLQHGEHDTAPRSQVPLDSRAVADAGKQGGGVVHPPGTILQHLYLKERIAARSPGRFVEVGVGSGHISNVLLSLGWCGAGYELNADAVARASDENRAFIESRRFTVVNGDWLTTSREHDGAVDVVISSMVLEHLDDDQVGHYFEHAAQQLRPGGEAVLLVPGSPSHWGIEDEIAGHHRRYTVASLSETVRRHGWSPTHVVGLTYPLSNLLLGVSNVLVRRAEQDKRSLSLRERTEQSGNRRVHWKTDFPRWVGVVVNETTLLPAHWLQKRERSRTAADALVVYCECRPPAARSASS